MNVEKSRIGEFDRVARMISGDETLTHKAFAVVLALLVAAFAGGVVVGFQTAVTIATAIGFVAAIVGLKKPGIGLLGIGLLCTLDPVSRVFVFGRGLLPWNTFNYLLVVVILLNGLFLLRTNDISSSLLKFFVGILALWLVLAPSGSLEVGFGQVLNVGTAFGLLVYFMRGLRTKEALYLTGIICGMVGLLAGLLYNVQLSRLAEMNHNAWAYVPLTAIFGLALALRAAPPRGSGQVWIALLALVNLSWVF